MRKFETIEPNTETLVTETTFNCGADCRNLGRPHDPDTTMHAGGAAFCSNCKVLPQNQSHHVCANRTPESNAAWLATETERLENRRMEILGLSRAAA